MDDSYCAVLLEPVANAIISVFLQSLSWARMMPADSSAYGYKGQRSPMMGKHYMRDGKKDVAAGVDIVVDMKRLVLERKLSVGIGEVADSQNNMEHSTDDAQSVGLLLLARSAYIRWFDVTDTQ